MMKRNAFTLSETLIMVAIVGVIATISVVSLKSVRPDKDALLIRKAYNEISSTVEAMINDETLYPTQVAYAEKMRYVLASTFKTVSLDLPSKFNGGDIPEDQYQIAAPTTNLGSSTPSYPILTSNNPNSSNSSNSSVSPVSSIVVPENSNPEQYAMQAITPDLTSLTSGVLTSNTPNSNNTSNTTPNPTGASNSQGTFTLNQGVTERSKSSVFTNRALPAGASGYTTKNKFSYNFALQFDKLENTIGTIGDNGCKFTTKDGMYWEITDNFGNASDPHAMVMVDINGTDKGANSSNPSGSTVPDRFNFKISPSGAISVSGTDKAATKATSVLSK